MTDVMEETSAVDLICEHVGPLAIRGDRWAQGVMASLAATPAAEQEAYAQTVCEALGRVIEVIANMVRPYAKAALADRRIRSAEVLEEAGVDPDIVGGETEQWSDGWKPDRFLLLEHQHRGVQSYYLTTHRTAEAAGAYHYGQEYCMDYGIEVLVDLDTGDRYEVEQRFVATKLERG
jgi:hypothetical protein